jgi:hypothetical protein
MKIRFRRSGLRLGLLGFVVGGVMLTLLVASATAERLTPSTLTASAGTLPLHLAIPWVASTASCPSGHTPTTECNRRGTGQLAVPGLGFVSQTYVAPIETAPASCPSGEYQISAYPAQFDVRGRGTISLSVAASSQCARPPTDILNVSQTFQIVGGTGVFAGASGSGVVSRTDTGYTDHGIGTDRWDGTITAPGWDAIDLTPPTIRGAANKIVRAPRNARTVRVRYRVTATDDADGTLSVRCKPASGSRFKVGGTRRVLCSADDLSANTAHAAFRVTVRHRRR